MPFDPDFQHNGIEIDTEITVTLPAGAPGDLLVAYIMSGAPDGGLHDLTAAGWDLVVQTPHDDDYQILLYSRIREAGEVDPVFETDDLATRELMVSILNIPSADMAGQDTGYFTTTSAEMFDNGIIVPLDTDVPQYLTMGTLLVDPDDTAGFTGTAGNPDGDWGYDPLPTASTLFAQLSGYDSPVGSGFAYFFIWVAETSGPDHYMWFLNGFPDVFHVETVWACATGAGVATEGWVTGRVAFG